MFIAYPPWCERAPRDARRTARVRRVRSANDVLRAAGEAAGAVDRANDEVGRLLAAAFDADRVLGSLRRWPARIDDWRLDHFAADHRGRGVLTAHLEYATPLCDV